MKRRRDDEEEPQNCSQKKSKAKHNPPIPSKRIQPPNIDPVHHTTRANAKLDIIERPGDIFDAPPNTLIIHACNCEGSWGAGIAKAFKQHFPKAFSSYRAQCKERGNDLLGTGLLIAPEEDSNLQTFVGCVFTSRSKGRSKDKPDQILRATRPAMEDLLTQVQTWNATRAEDENIEEIRMCKINSGLFAVPWKDTKAELESLTTRPDLPTRLLVITRSE